MISVIMWGQGKCKDAVLIMFCLSNIFCLDIRKVCGNMAFSAGVALTLTLAFETPMFSFEKIIFGTGTKPNQFILVYMKRVLSIRKQSVYRC